MAWARAGSAPRRELNCWGMHSRILVALLVTAAALAQPRLLKVDDLHRFREVRDVQISPDGKWVAYTVTNVDTGADKSDSDIWMTSWDGTQHMRMTSSTENETAPRWSPDGRWLAFLSSRPGAAKGNQVWPGPQRRRQESNVNPPKMVAAGPGK